MESDISKLLDKNKRLHNLLFANANNVSNQSILAICNIGKKGN